VMCKKSEPVVLKLIMRDSNGFHIAINDTYLAGLTIVSDNPAFTVQKVEIGTQVGELLLILVENVNSPTKVNPSIKINLDVLQSPTLYF